MPLAAIIHARQGEELLVHLTPLIDIGMQVDFSGLYRGVPKILLDNAEVLGSLVQFAGIAVANLVGGDSLWSIMFEDMLDCSGRDVFSLLPHKERASDPVPDECIQFRQGIFIDKDNPDLISLPPYPDGMLVNVDIIDIDGAKLRDSDARRIYGSDNETIPRILN
jgi:hypothetical protein